MGRFLTAAILLGAIAAPALAQQKCGGGTLCPEDTPCCSLYGQCGTGAYCLGGCDPINSFSLNACAPMPMCKSANYNFNNLDDIAPNTKYLGDASKADWVSSGEPVEYSKSLLLTMAQGTVGTLLASNHYVWYGKVSATLKTSAGAGVVTAFIMMSDTKDEIDFEWIGTDLTTVQTNFYSLGITNYNNGKNASVSSDTMANSHTYEIDWSPDQLTWSVDGNVVRTLKKSDTWNSTSNRYSYPQSPSRVQLSLWPAGLPTNPKGTIDWAGGEISWNSPYMANGYYYSQFTNVNIECYPTPSDAQGSGSVSYVLTNSFANESDFSVTNQPTVLGSFAATGLNMDFGKSDKNATQQTNSTIPGLTGVGPGNTVPGSDSGDSSGGSSSSSSGNNGQSASNGFVQNTNSASGIQAEKLSGSIFAAVMAILGLCML